MVRSFMVIILGMMGENIKDTGKMVNNMEKENFTTLKKIAGRKGYGVKVGE